MRQRAAGTRPPTALAFAASLAAVAALGLATSALAEGVPSGQEACRVSAEVHPARAVPGQQILYVARIVRREDVTRIDWERPLSFPGFRAEWLPGRAEDTTMHYRGVSYLAREEHRALFAARPGDFTLPVASVRCVIGARGPRPESVAVVELPPIEVRIDPIPVQGRPPGFAGLVGPVHAQAIAEPSSLALGGTVGLSIQVRGANNLWAIGSPLGEGSLEGADLFAHPPELALDEGQRLGVRRFFRYRIVPRRTGRLRIPALRFAYYDPALRRFGRATTRALEIEVTPRPAADPRRWPPDAATPGEAGAGSGEAAASGPTPWLVVGVAGLVLLAGGAVLAVRRGRAHPWKDVERALQAAGAAAERGDPLAEARELSRALRAALARVAPAKAKLDPEALRRSASSAPEAVPPEQIVEVAAQLEALDWIRFSSELGHPDAPAARRSIEALRKSL
ncbi:MAG: hypothetical protein ACQGVK_20040 [Myxococcota bacterium]